MNEQLPVSTPDLDSESTELPESTILANAIKDILQQPPEEQEVLIKDLRRRRRLNDYERSDESILIDDAIIELFSRGEVELASRLVIPSYSERGPLEKAILRRYNDDDEAATALTTVTTIMIEKTQVLSEQIHDHLEGISPEIINELAAELKSGVSDPESALEVSPEFWAGFFDLPETARDAILHTSGPLSRAVETIGALEEGGLLEYAKEFMRPALALSPQDRGEYIASASEAIRGFTTNYPELSLSRFEISLLASHRAPHVALELAIRSFPSKLPSTALNFLNSELGIIDQDIDAEPSIIPQEVIALLPDLNEAMRNVGVSSYEAPRATGECLKLGAEAFETILPDFIKSIEETSMLREGLTMYSGASSESINARTINSIQFAGEELRAIFIPGDRLDTEEKIRHLQRFAAKQHAVNRDYELTKDFLHRIRNSALAEANGQTDPEANSSSSSIEEKIERRGLDRYFDGLGIPKELQVKLFDSWMSYAPAGFALSQYNKKNVKDLTDVEIEISSIQTTKVFYEQLTAVQQYCEQYSTEELIELHDIFGIVHFTRGSAEQLHDQLLRWKDLESPVKNINVAATDDYNFAFGNTAKVFFESFGEEGSFYFEAPTIPRLSRAFVQVGARERAAGREPSEASQVQNVVISGHGEPVSIELSYGNSINIKNFAEAAHARQQFAEIDSKARLEPNDYSQYIGHSYRIILHACSTGKEMPESLNISRVLNIEYGVPVDASPLDSSGYNISEKGNVSYKVSNENGDQILVDSVRHE